MLDRRNAIRMAGLGLAGYFLSDIIPYNMDFPSDNYYLYANYKPNSSFLLNYIFDIVRLGKNDISEFPLSLSTFDQNKISYTLPSAYSLPIREEVDAYISIPTFNVSEDGELCGQVLRKFNDKLNLLACQLIYFAAVKRKQFFVSNSREDIEDRFVAQLGTKKVQSFDFGPYTLGVSGENKPIFVIKNDLRIQEFYSNMYYADAEIGLAVTDHRQVAIAKLV